MTIYNQYFSNYLADDTTCREVCHVSSAEGCHVSSAVLLISTFLLSLFRKK